MENGDEIKSGLKLWEVLKLSDEHGGLDIKPDHFECTYYSFKYWVNDVRKPFANDQNTWSVKIPAKRVEITKLQLEKIYHENGYDVTFAALCKELGL